MNTASREVPTTDPPLGRFPTRTIPAASSRGGTRKGKASGGSHRTPSNREVPTKPQLKGGMGDPGAGWSPTSDRTAERAPSTHKRRVLVSGWEG
jgi:hypothetical protein